MCFRVENGCFVGDLGGVKGDFSLDKIGKKKGFEF